MPVHHFTPKGLRALPAINGKPTDYRDDLVTGLVLRVLPPSRRNRRGLRVWYLIYKRHGRNRPYKLGLLGELDLGQVRDLARDLRAKVRLGADPQVERLAERQRARQDVTGLCRLYLQEEGPKSLSPRTASEWKRLVEADIAKSAIGQRPASELTRGEILVWSKAIAERTPDGAAHAFAVLRRVYSWAVGCDRLPGSPFVGLTPPARPRRSARVLSTRELRALVLALRDLEDDGGAYCDAVRLLLFTMARASMVTGMAKPELEEIDSALPRWVVPPRVGLKRRRGGPEHVVPLVADAVAVIRRRLHAIGPSPYLFPTAPAIDGEPRKHETTSITSGFMDRLRAALDVRYAADELGLDLDQADRRAAQTAREKAMIALAKGHVERRPRWTVHDLRKAAATHMREDLDVDPEVVSLLLAHTRPTRKGAAEVTRVYDRAELLGPRRAALVAWAAWLGQLAAGVGAADASTGAKVLPMTRS